MLAILVLVLAALSRLLPHIFHNMAFNFTAVGRRAAVFRLAETTLADGAGGCRDGADGRVSDDEGLRLRFPRKRIPGDLGVVCGGLFDGQRAAAQGDGAAGGGRRACLGDQLLPAE